MALEDSSGDAEMEGVTILPQDIDASNKLAGCYGTTEEECAAAAIVRACSINNSWAPVDVTQFPFVAPAGIIMRGLRALQERGMIRVEGSVVTPLASFVEPTKRFAKEK